MDSVAMAAIGNGHVAQTSTAGGTPVSAPCAGCKFLRRKCQPDCVFAPYFPPDQPQKFVNVHRVFGASNVTKILNELHPFQREDAVNSLAYEAEMRLRDPVYGCVGIISLLQHELRQLQLDLSRARSELSKYQSAAAAAAGGGVGMEQVFLPAPLQQQRMAAMRGYPFSAEIGSGGGYDAGLVAMAGLGQFAGQIARSNAAGGEGRPSSIGPL